MKGKIMSRETVIQSSDDGMQDRDVQINVLVNREWKKKLQIFAIENEESVPVIVIKAVNRYMNGREDNIRG